MTLKEENRLLRTLLNAFIVAAQLDEEEAQRDRDRDIQRVCVQGSKRNRAGNVVSVPTQRTVGKRRVQSGVGRATRTQGGVVQYPAVPGPEGRGGPLREGATL